MSRNHPPRQASLYRALLPGALILGALIVIALFIMWLSNSSQAEAEVAAGSNDQLSASTMQQFQQDYDRYGVAVGAVDAPVTIREFADYQCPACASFAPTAARIRNELVASGKVRFIFFDFPLPMHDHAFAAAVAARCAGEQGQYWAYQEALFAKQQKWAAQDDPTPVFLDLAVENGIDVQQLKQCMAEDKMRNLVQKNRDLAQQLRLRATPTIIIGNKVISGALSYDSIKAEVEHQAGQQ